MSAASSPAAGAHPFGNPGRTKLALVTWGVRLEGRFRRPSRWIAAAGAAETVLDLRLPSGHFCTVPVGMPFCEGSPIALAPDEARGEARLVWGGEELPVELVPAPRFYRRRTRGGARMGSFAALHDRLLLLHPWLGCGFFARGNEACRFCLYDSMLNAPEPPLRDPLELVEAVRAAMAEREVDTVYLYNGFSPAPDRGLRRLAPVVALLRRHLGHRQIAVDTVAPEDPEAIDAIYAAGADLFVCNLEVFDPERFAELCPGKAAHGGQALIWQALEHARGVFRAGSVASSLIVGLEPPAATNKGVDALVDAGIVPLLVPFRPVPDTPLADASPPGLEDVEAVVQHWYARLLDAPMPMHRLREMGRVLTPMESRVLEGGRPTLGERLRTTGLGRRFAGWEDALRRRLRTENGAQVLRGPIHRIAARRLAPSAALAALFALAAWAGARTPPAGLAPAGWKALVILALSAVLWATRLLPLPIAALLGLGLLPAAGVMPAGEAFALFGSPAVFFVLGAFLLAAGLARLGVAEWLAVHMLARAAASPGRLVGATMLLSAGLATVMPEHAAAAIVMPIAQAALRELGIGRERAFAQAMLLAVAWGAVIGGIATMLGGARASLALAVLAATTGRGFSFLDWTLAALPAVLVLLGAAALVLRRLAGRPSWRARQAQEVFARRALELGNLDASGKLMLLLMGATVLAWAAFGEGLGLAAIALLAAAAMFALRLVPWEALEREVPWGVILLYGGAIALGKALAETGAAAWLADRVLVHEAPLPLLVALVALATLLLTELMSNAAAVAVLLPLAIPALGTAGASPVEAALVVGIAAGCAFVLPTGAPANAMALAAGVRAPLMLKNGPALSLAALVAIAASAVLLWPHLLEASR